MNVNLIFEASHVTPSITPHVTVYPPPRDVRDVPRPLSQTSFYLDDLDEPQSAGASVPPSAQPATPDPRLLTPRDDRSPYVSPSSSVDYLGRSLTKNLWPLLC